MSEYRDQVLQDSPICYVRLGEATTATPPQDISGNNYHAGWIGNPVLGQPGIIRYDTDTAVRLIDNSDDTHIEWADPDLFVFNDGLSDSPFTLEAWLLINTMQSVQQAAILSKDSASTGQREWSLTLQTDRTVEFRIYDTGGHAVQDRHHSIITQAPLSAPALGERYHIVATYDGSADINGMAIWVNGVAQPVTQDPYLSYTIMRLPGIAPTRIGKLGIADYFVDSTIDEVAIYDKVLADDRIQAHALQGHYAGFGQLTHNFRQHVILARGPILSYPFLQTVVPTYGRVKHNFLQSVVSYGQVTHNFQQTVTPWTGQVKHNFRQTVTTYGQVTHKFRQTVYNPATLPEASKSWRVSVIIDGVDISAQLTGQLSVSAEESAARTANFIFFPAPGFVDPGAYIDKPVFIVYTDSFEAQYLLFTGIVDTPVYDPIASTLTLNCTDQYQELLDNMSKASIDALIGGYWSKHIFRENVGSHQYALDKLKTVRASLDMDVQRGWHLKHWDVESASPDFSVTGNEVYDNSKQLRLADRRNIRNRTEVTFRHRYQRLYHRERYPSWQYPFQWCQYLQRSTTLPNRDMVLVSIERSGWALADISFTPLPESGVFYCGQGQYFWTNTFPSLIRGYSASCVRRWTQTLTGTYQLTLDAVDGLQLLTQEKQHSLNTRYDPVRWESQANTPTGEQEDGRWGSGISVIGRDNNTTYKPPTNSEKNSWGDWVLDEDDPGEANNAIVTFLAVQQRDLAKKHRQNFISWAMPILPILERYHVMDLATYNLTASGKVFQYTHRLNILSGEATTDVTLALSKTYGNQTFDSPLIVPSKPDITPAPPGQIIPQLPQSTQIGGDLSSPVHNPDKDGYSGNYAILSPGSEVYPVQFLTILPAVEDELRDAATWDVVTTYQVRIPDDKLTMSAA